MSLWKVTKEYPESILVTFDRNQTPYHIFNEGKSPVKIFTDEDKKNALQLNSDSSIDIRDYSTITIVMIDAESNGTYSAI